MKTDVARQAYLPVVEALSLLPLAGFTIISRAWTSTSKGVMVQFSMASSFYLDKKCLGRFYHLNVPTLTDQLDRLSDFLFHTLENHKTHVLVILSTDFWTTAIADGPL